MLRHGAVDATRLGDEQRDVVAVVAKQLERWNRDHSGCRLLDRRTVVVDAGDVASQSRFLATREQHREHDEYTRAILTCNYHTFA